jgi:hypothetical protein
MLGKVLIWALANRREWGRGAEGQRGRRRITMTNSQFPIPNSQFPIPNNLKILYISVGKNCPLQLKIKMRAVDKTLIST